MPLSNINSPEPAPKRLRSEDARQYAYRLIRLGILELQFAPEQKLNELELARQLQISRTPVHDALCKLAREKLIDIIPNRGAFVARLSPEHIRHSIWLHQRLGQAALQAIYIRKPGSTQLKLLLRHFETVVEACGSQAPATGRISALSNTGERTGLNCDTGSDAAQHTGSGATQHIDSATARYTGSSVTQYTGSGMTQHTDSAAAQQFFAYLQYLYELAGEMDYIWDALEKVDADFRRMLCLAGRHTLLSPIFFTGLAQLYQALAQRSYEQAIEQFGEQLLRCEQLLPRLMTESAEYFSPESETDEAVWKETDER